jgi:hypothetical protein
MPLGASPDPSDGLLRVGKGKNGGKGGGKRAANSKSKRYADRYE